MTAGPAEGAPTKARPEVSERAFKQIAFWSTLAGLVLMAIGLRALLFDANFLLFILLFAGGGVLASVTVWLRPRAEPGFVVELYTRDGCSLCEEAAAWLNAKAPEYDFAVWEVDVDRDPALEATYGDVVPVGILNGKEELFRLKADYPTLERRFRRLADARVRGGGR